MSDNILWSELFDAEREPSDIQIRDFINASLWDDICSHLQQVHGVKPKLSHCSCSMDKGF